MLDPLNRLESPATQEDLSPILKLPPGDGQLLSEFAATETALDGIATRVVSGLMLQQYKRLIDLLPALRLLSATPFLLLS